MPTLYVGEVDKLGVDSRGKDIMAPAPFIVEQIVTIGMTHAESAAFTGATRFVQLSTDATCSIVIGFNPVATTSNDRMVQNEKVFRTVEPGMKVSVIVNT